MTDPFLTVLRPEASPPPLAWLRTIPEWWEPEAGKGITIVTDPESPEAGRAVGYVSPPSGGRCYLKAPDATVCVPTPPESPDGYRIFHADTITMEGEQVEIGSIALGGGHSNRVNASTPTEAQEFLQRKARWSEMAEDIALYGQVTHTDEGLLFRGWTAESVTIAEAEMINRTIMSGEWIPDPELGGKLVFAGVARVQRTALPMRELPMAADLLDCGCNLDQSMVQTFAPADWEQEMAVRAETGQIDPNIMVTNTTGTMTIQQEPVRAAIEDEVAELRGMVNDLTVQVEALTEEVQTLSAMAVEDEAAGADGPTITLEEIMQELLETKARVNELQGITDAQRAAEQRAQRDAEQQDTSFANRNVTPS